MYIKKFTYLCIVNQSNKNNFKFTKMEQNFLVKEFNNQFKTNVNNGYNTNVIKSTDYGMFTYFPMNRYGGGENQEILLEEQKKSFERRVKRLMKLLVNGFNPYLPIKTCIIDGELYVLEGQHRIEVCKRLGIPFYYELLPISDFETGIQLFYTLNNTGSKWDLIDKIVSNIHNPLLSDVERFENQRMVEIKNKYRVPMWIVKYVCYGQNSHKQEEMTKVPKYKDDSEHIFDLSLQICTTSNMDRKLMNDRSFVRSVSRMVRSCGYNSEFEKRIINHKFKFEKGMTDREYLREFTRYGNKNIKTGSNYVDLVPYV